MYTLYRCIDHKSDLVAKSCMSAPRAHDSDTRMLRPLRPLKPIIHTLRSRPFLQSLRRETQTRGSMIPLHHHFPSRPQASHVTFACSATSSARGANTRALIGSLIVDFGFLPPVRSTLRWIPSIPLSSRLTHASAHAHTQTHTHTQTYTRRHAYLVCVIVKTEDFRAASTVCIEIRNMDRGSRRIDDGKRGDTLGDAV